MNRQKGQGNAGRMDSRRWEEGIVRGEGSTGRVCGGAKARRSGGWAQTVWGSYVAESGLYPVLVGWVAYLQVLIFPFVFNSVLTSSLGGQGCLDLAVLKN